MVKEPEVERAVSFFDGQNLFHHARGSFGHSRPNSDPRRSSEAVCVAGKWDNHGVRFHTGVPDAKH